MGTARINRFVVSISAVLWRFHIRCGQRGLVLTGMTVALAFVFAMLHPFSLRAALLPTAACGWIGLAEVALVLAWPGSDPHTLACASYRGSIIAAGALPVLLVFWLDLSAWAMPLAVAVVADAVVFFWLAAGLRPWSRLDLLFAPFYEAAPSGMIRWPGVRGWTPGVRRAIAEAMAVHPPSCVPLVRDVQRWAGTASCAPLRRFVGGSDFLFNAQRPPWDLPSLADWREHLGKDVADVADACAHRAELARSVPGCATAGKPRVRL